MRFVRSCRALARPSRSRFAARRFCPAGRSRHGGSRQGDAGRRRGDGGEGTAGPGQGARSARQFFAGLYIYGNPESKLYDVNKATPLLLDAAERGYVPAMLPHRRRLCRGQGRAEERVRSLQVGGDRRALERTRSAAIADRAAGARAEARRDREGQGAQPWPTPSRRNDRAAGGAARGAACRQQCRARANRSTRSRRRAAACASAVDGLSRRRSRRRRGGVPRAGRRATPTPRPGWARCCSTADATAKACATSSMPPTPARAKARIGWRWSTPKVSPARRATTVAPSSCSRRPPRPATRAPRSISASSICAARACRADLMQARAWLEKAAAGGDPQALYALGRAMSESSGRPCADPVRAADLYRRAAEKGHALAGLRYGLALSEGIGIKRDRRRRAALADAGAGERRARSRAGDGRHGGAHARLARQGGQREDRAVGA